MADFLTSPEVLSGFFGLLGIIITAIIARVSAAVTLWTGVKIEEKHQRALHEALMSGARAAVKFGPNEAVSTMKALAIAHARESVPDAIKALTPGNGVLDNIAERYVNEAMERIFLAAGAEPK